MIISLPNLHILFVSPFDFVESCVEVFDFAAAVGLFFFGGAMVYVTGAIPGRPLFMI